ncbi:MAG: hypothetical protein WB992_16020, partial [Bryobacteraceae bacterium]
MSNELNRRAVTVGLAGSLITVAAEGASKKPKTDECSTLVSACDDDPISVPGPLMAYWLVRTMGHCICKPLDDAIAGHDDKTVNAIAQCLGLTGPQHAFLHKVYSAHSDAFKEVGKAWKNDALGSPRISSFKGFS